MTTKTKVRNMNPVKTFEDLKGLRAEGYIRDSTLDQRDGFGPEMQRKAIDSFAHTYGLILGDEYYTDFITGTSTLKRLGFHRALADAQIGCFDVLLVYHTSRFARNRADAIRCKMELKKLGIVLIFISQNIISGNDKDFLNEGINEVLDEQVSRNISFFVADGLKTKYESGIANGKPPLGFKSEKVDNGRERKVPDMNGIGGNPKIGGIDALLALLTEYRSGRCSYQQLADHLNAQGYRTRLGRLFTKGSVEQVLKNRLYEGKVIYHLGKSDEEVRDGKQEVSEEIKELWKQCQEVKRRRNKQPDGRPRLPRRAYPFSKVALCDACSQNYVGQPSQRNSGRVIRRLYHNHPFCELTPHSVGVENLAIQFQEGVLPYVVLGQDWKETIVNSLQQGPEVVTHEQDKARLERALINLRKQHLWEDITDEEYRQQRNELKRQLNDIPSADNVARLPNLE